ncbi:MAG: hypothetical protein AB8B93_02005 [Pseudomonadales bacterium]
MRKETLLEVLDCIGSERRLFWYFPGRFALLLLAESVARGRSLHALRAGPEARLLQQAVVRDALGQQGNGALQADALANYWTDQALPFALTIGSWGSTHYSSWRQTSRSGYNLVLRLDFTGAHMASLRRRFGDYGWLFNSDLHPVSQSSNRRRETLAWARLDFDFDTNEVLIEEVQSDWVRDAARAARYGWYSDGGWIKPETAAAYLREELQPLLKLWPEAMLAACLWFIRNELGIGRVFYHEHRTGSALKQIRHAHPPRSLYSKLPQRFCMELVDEPPLFLANDKRTKRVLKKVRPHHFYTRDLTVGSVS